MILKLVVLALYFLILLSIGFFASKRVSNISDYYVGGKKLGYWIAALSARSTGESGWLLIGVTGMGALMGVSAFWIVIGEVIGVWISWQFMAKKFKRMTDEYDSITIPDFLVSHFRSTTHTIRIVAATALSLFVVIYVSAQIDITGKTFESFLGFNYYTGIAIGFGIVVVYIFSGGFLAVAWSDFFQGSLMFVGLLLLPVVAYFSLSGDASIIEGDSSIMVECVAPIKCSKRDIIFLISSLESVFVSIVIFIMIASLLYYKNLSNVYHLMTNFFTELCQSVILFIIFFFNSCLFFMV